METSGIDASLGLALAIDLLKQHQQTGELRGTIAITRYLTTKRYQCIIQVVQGHVVACSLIDKLNRIQPTDERYLIQVDEKNGPFDWTFYPQEEGPSSSTPVPHASSTGYLPAVPRALSLVQDNAVPFRLTPGLQLSWLTTWSEDEIRLLQQIFSLTNGKRTVHEMKLLLFRVAPATVEKALIFLIAMKQVEIRNPNEVYEGDI